MLFELGFFFLWMGDSLSIKYLRVCLISPFAVRDCAAHLTGVLDQVADVFRAAAAYYFALLVSDRMNTERQVKIFREDPEMIYVLYVNKVLLLRKNLYNLTEAKSKAAQCRRRYT